MPHLTFWPASPRVIAWSRTALLIGAALLLAGVSTKIILTGGTPFGWSGHWTLDASYGTALRTLAALLWVPALVGRLDRGVLVATVVLAFSVPPTDHAFSLVTAVVLIVLPLWIIRKTVAHLPPSGPRAHAASAA